jgi:RNA polymerase sigma-70 factor (ECF subfamily)
MASLPPDSGELTEAYLRLLATIERSLSTYVYGLVASGSDAQDILQEVRISMWKHFPSFEPGTNARAWAYRIALNHILNYRRSEKKRPNISLDEAFVEAVTAEIDRQGDRLDQQSDALKNCRRKLPEPHRKIILWRYYEDCGIDEIAQKSQRTVDAVYRLLSRIREVLQECVQRGNTQSGVL